MLAIGDRVELEFDDPFGPSRKFYALEVAHDRQLALFPENSVGAVLVIMWGPMGKRPRVLRERFATMEAMEKRWNALLARRKRHGYAVVHRRHARGRGSSSSLRANATRGPESRTAGATGPGPRPTSPKGALLH